MRVLAIVSFALCISACLPEEDGAQSDSPELMISVDRVEQARKACKADNGRFQPGIRPETFVCYRDTRDAGEFCRTSRDCTTHCLARSKSCAPITPLLGCHEVLGPSGRQTTLCIE